MKYQRFVPHTWRTLYEKGFETVSRDFFCRLNAVHVEDQGSGLITSDVNLEEQKAHALHKWLWCHRCKNIKMWLKKIAFSVSGTWTIQSTAGRELMYERK